ncbi:TPA: hypothetical protein QH731_003552 [Klebsiella variicola]|nr:hypothetical protein [Klebsiella variicola]
MKIRKAKDVWVTVKECEGVPGFPSTAPNVRNMLERLTTGAPDKKRKREKTKAYEYNATVLPAETLEYFGLVAEGETQPKEDRKNEWNDGKASSESVLLFIFNMMNDEQKAAAADIFISGGLNALMPGLAQSLLKPEATKEILCQDNSTESTNPAPQVSTHGKKAG